MQHCLLLACCKFLRCVLCLSCVLCYSSHYVWRHRNALLISNVTQNYISLHREEKWREMSLCGCCLLEKWKSLLNFIVSSKSSLRTMNEKRKTITARLGKLRLRLFFLNNFAWIDWICFGLNAFFTVENDPDRRYSKKKHISYKTFMKYLELVTPNLCGKRKSWDKQTCVGISWMGEMQIFLKLMMKETLQKKFWHKKRTKKNLDIWTAISFTHLKPCWAFFHFVGNCVNSASSIFSASKLLKDQPFLKVNKWFWSPICRICL